MKVPVLGCVIGLAVGACFVKPESPGNEASDAAISDGFSVVDGLISSDCLLEEDFSSSGSGCGAWGSAQGSGSQSIARASGELVMTSGVGGGFSACESLSSVPITTGIVQITELVTAMGGRVGVLLTFDEMPARMFELDIATNSNLSMGTLTARFNNGPASMMTPISDTDLFYRFRLVNNILRLDWSPDRITWSTEQQYALGYTPATVKARLYANYSPNGTSQTARFGYIQGCQ